MRLATFNILNGRSPTDDRVDVARFADAVGRLDADVLGLQEVDRNQPRSEHADLTAVAAEAMGAVEHRFVAALAGSPGATWNAATGDEQPDAAAYGVALLSRYPVTGWEVVRLAPVPTRFPMMFKGSRRPTWVRDEPRVAVVATVQTPYGELSVVNTHLSFIPWWHGRQLHSLVRSVEHVRRPLVLMGDLNMRPTRAQTLTGMRPLASGLTFEAHAPREQIDHVLLDGELESRGAVRGRPANTSSAAVDLPLSDHRALVVDVE
jgi:endonuclease/exonuclease/phosphatase family metal-dependent hydrolase